MCQMFGPPATMARAVRLGAYRFGPFPVPVAAGIHERVGRPAGHRSNVAGGVRRRARRWGLPRPDLTPTDLSIIGRYHRLHMLDRLIRYMLNRPDVWFARMGEIAAAFRAAE